jgi:fatty-acyl-CoA synthase
MNDAKTQHSGSAAVLQPTPTLNTIAFRAANFATLSDALDYAAQGVTGVNFYDGRGNLAEVLTYTQLRNDAIVLAKKLLSLNLRLGDRVAIIAETNANFLRFFFACQYARLVPLALPMPVSLGGHTAYETQLRNLLINSQCSIAVSPPSCLSYLAEASKDLDLQMVGSYDDFRALADNSKCSLPSAQADDIAYLQYTSGSTRFPRGVIIKQSAVIHNLAEIVHHGMKINANDSCFSWLPFYHDMGLVGFVLTPIATQLSASYLDTREFAKRPRLWLKLMSETQATLSFSPSFGYELCARRLRPGEAEQYNLRHWRIAGIGAEMIRPHVLVRFADALASAQFDRKALLPCYGMAECCLAISFAPLSQSYTTDWIDGDYLDNHQQALPLELAEDPGRAIGFVNCGKPLPSYQVEIRNEAGEVVPERHAGIIFIKGPSVMTGYFNAPEETAAALSTDGWLDTGDIGYRIGDDLVITGRQKDLIIINGRNIRPQDLEYIAEHQPETRSGDAVAFAITSAKNQERCILMVQCRETISSEQQKLTQRLVRQVKLEMGIDCHVELVPPRSLPRTSSGKPSRAKARQAFIESHDIDALFVVD